jgi:NAD(P)-dependent dehydrogenase (short-subunit alcohol dehydrogenase family)
VTSTHSVTAYIAALPPMNLVINNAAILADRSVATMTDEDFDSVLDTCLTGAFRVARAVLPSMMKQGAGHIINIGSFSALSGPRGQANYAAAKAGLIALTQSLALEGGPDNIRANTVLPGYLDTAFSAAALAQHRSAILAQHALGRLNTVEEAARFIVELHGFAHISGQLFQLDSRLSPWA